MIHIYCGNGKGKTTAAVGLAVRAAGAGKRVLFTQFFKNGHSSEIRILQELHQVEVKHSAVHYGRFQNMTDEKRKEARFSYTRLLDEVLRKAENGVDILILDEVLPACKHQMVPEEVLLDFLRNRPEGLEVVLTGREPSQPLLQMADYITEMRKVRHPYDRQIKARKGIEF